MGVAEVRCGNGKLRIRSLFFSYPCFKGYIRNPSSVFDGSVRWNIAVEFGLATKKLFQILKN